jgi:hypothetical protein
MHRTLLQNDTVVISSKDEWFDEDGCNIIAVCRSGTVELEDML